MRFFSAAEIDGLLTFPALVDALGAAFRGDIVTPVRHHHEVARPDATGTLLLMPAWTGPEISPAYLGTKVATVYPGNASKGLPSVMGTYLLMDGATGKPLAALDGTRLTLWRTAAALNQAGLLAIFWATPSAARTTAQAPSLRGQMSPSLIG